MMARQSSQPKSRFDGERIRSAPRGRGGHVFGFTLVELVVTLAVAAVLLVLAAPFYTKITERNTLNAVSTLLSGHMQLARSEAIKRGGPVTLCPSGDGTTCAGTTRWELGWLVFRDDGAAGQVDVGDELIAVSPALDSPSVTVGVSHVYIRYLSDGSLQLP